MLNKPEPNPKPRFGTSQTWNQCLAKRLRVCNPYRACSL